MSQACQHLHDIHTRGANSAGCEECLKIGEDWVHLRVCMVCGHVGCCDDSKNKHATQHFHATGHPAIRSSARRSRARRGAGAMWTSCSTIRSDVVLLSGYALRANPTYPHWRAASG